MSSARLKPGIRSARSGSASWSSARAKRCPHAEVDTGTEGHLGGRPLAGDIEDVGILERVGVAVRTGQ